MNITHNVLVGFVSVALALSAAFAYTATAQSDLDVVRELERQLAELTAQLSAVQSQSGTTTSAVVVTTGGGVCPYTWARNLTIGSTGEDVRQLQRFLNSDPQTQVATSGVGSPGNETSYYGPATGRAVSKFQEKYAAQVLAPFGLTRGTGGFYTSTRKQANSMCATGGTTVAPAPTPGVRPSTPALPSEVRVSGDALAVTPGRQIGDSYALQSAQRVPFTSFVLTAGNEDVRIEGIRVSRVGLSSSDDIDSVALVDANGVQIGNSRSLNSRDEATLGGNLVIPRNRSVTLAIVANMSKDDVNSGAVIGLEVTEVAANTGVQGAFPIRGAMHAVADSVGLQAVDVEFMKGDDEVDFDEDTEVVTLDIDLTSSTAEDSNNDSEPADQEDAYLRSIAFEQVGSADEREVGDLAIYIDDDEVDARVTVDDDRYVITFGGRGVEIEEGDSVTLSVEVNTDEGTGETIKFELDDVSDIYIVGASYGYGLPVMDKTGSSYMNWDGAIIQAGSIEGGNVRDFDDEITYGDDRVIGALEVEFEGEDIAVEDITFSIQLDAKSQWNDTTDNPWHSADEDEVTLDNLHLRVDGKKVLYADDTVEFGEPATKQGADITVENVDFSGSFTIDVRGNRDVRFELVADLDEAWSHFDGAMLQAKIISVKEAEGIRSEEDFTTGGKFFDTSGKDSNAGDLEFESIDIVGNEIEFNISDDGVEEDSFVSGAENVILGTLEIDAGDAIDDVEIDNLYITFTTDAVNSELSHLDDCRILDRQGDEVADSRGNLSSSPQSGTTKEKDQVRFNFDRYTVEAGGSADLDIVCDVDDDAEENHAYMIAADTTSGDKVEYTIGRDDFEYELTENDKSTTVTVAGSGTLSISFDNPDRNNKRFPVAVGESGERGVEVLEIEFEAEDENILIKDIYLGELALLAGSTSIDEASLEKIIRGFDLTFSGGSSARPRDFEASHTEKGQAITNSIKFENINETIEVGQDTTVKLTIDFVGNNKNKGQAGQYLKGDLSNPNNLGPNLYIVWEGEETEEENITKVNISGSDFSEAVTFRGGLMVTNPRDPGNDLSNGKEELYEFTVSALDENVDEVYLAQVAVEVSMSSGVAIDVLEIYDNAGGSGKPLATMNNSGSGYTSASSHVVAFNLSDDIQEFDPGESITYSIWAKTVSGATENSRITIDLANDDDTDDTAKLGEKFVTVKDASNFVWSPNSLENKGSIVDANTDWFSGWAVYEDSDLESWTTERS